MFRRLCYLVLALAIFVNCKSETAQKKDSSLQTQLDSIEKANNQSVIDSGENISKVYVDAETDEFAFWADMQKDHRFYGYEKPDISSKRLILFSVFTNDVDGNPFGLPLGSYYDTRGLEPNSITYNDDEGDFISTDFVDAQGKETTIYFEKKWVILQGDEYNPEEDDEAIREYGKVIKFEDGAYPMYIMYVDFPERNFDMEFNLNIEAVNIDGETLNNLPGKYMTFYYTSELVDDLNDIHFEGKSLYGKYAPEMDDSWNKFTGILSGAKSLSGDLPNLVTITNTDGEIMNFELYVDDTVQKAEGKEVTVFHSIRGLNNITYIEPWK